MSLSIGQNPGYINNIETGKAKPYIGAFFYIREYLGVKPSEFFDVNSATQTKLNEIVFDIKRLNTE